MASQFSDDGKYFAQFSIDGKLQIWETKEDQLQQEYTPDFHLTSPCTCLHFVDQNSVINKNGSPKKKMRKHSIDVSTPLIALGTSTGILFVYSIAKGDVIFNMNSNTSQSIKCLSWHQGDEIYSAIDKFVVNWSIQKRQMLSKWKAGNEIISSLLILPDYKRLITASRNIKLWDIETKEVLRTFIGHSSEVHLLHHVKPEGCDTYFISGAKGDRMLRCWNINEEKNNANAVANLTMEDCPTNVSHKFLEDGSTILAATTKNGILHIYKHTLNGKCGKPLKPKTTIQVASDVTNAKAMVTPIPILNAIFHKELGLLICHGFLSLLVFEHMDISNCDKVQCLIRKDLRKRDASEGNHLDKVKTPVVDSHVQYLTPNTTAKAIGKRKSETVNDVPMELRLENLNLINTNVGPVPKSDNLAQLLVQGLHSKDKDILRTVLHVNDQKVIRNTISRLPINVIVPLINELNRYIQGKTAMCNFGVLWLKQVMNIHAGILLANPELSGIIGPALSAIENRLTLFNPLNSLKGRLNLLVTQLSVDVQKDVEDDPFLIFNDKDSTDEDEMEGIEIAAHSDSENEWDEEESSDDEEKDDDEANGSNTNNLNSDEEENEEEMSC